MNTSINIGLEQVSPQFQVITITGEKYFHIYIKDVVKDKVIADFRYEKDNFEIEELDDILDLLDLH